MSIEKWKDHHIYHVEGHKMRALFDRAEKAEARVEELEDKAKGLQLRLDAQVKQKHELKGMVEELGAEMEVTRRKLASAKRFVGPEEWDEYIKGINPEEAGE